MKKTYVVKEYVGKGWALWIKNGKRALKIEKRKQDVVDYGKQLAERMVADLIVYKKDGTVQKTVHFYKNAPKKGKKGPAVTLYEKKQRTASHAGFHFHNLYQCCQMKWAIRFLFRINTKHVATPLINGHAFHEGKAEFYLTKSKKKALAKCRFEIKDRRKEFENDEEYQRTLDRCPTLLEHWIDKFGQADLKRFRIVGVERAIEMKLPGTDFVITARLDAIVQEKTGDKAYYILETKTSSFSIRTTELGVFYGDQATLYTWMAEQHYNIKLDGVIPDIAYWNKQSNSTSNIQCVRGDIIQRSERRQMQTVNGLKQLQSEMSQKIEAVKQGADPYTLFPRNTFYCNAYYKACEFATICDTNLAKVKKLPPGFVREEGSVKAKTTDYVEDICSGALY